MKWHDVRACLGRIFAQAFGGKTPKGRGSPRWNRHSKGHLQAKWVNDSGKSEKSFMGGESFQGMGSGDGVDLVLDEVDFRRGDL